jgi:hypothetical protein
MEATTLADLQALNSSIIIGEPDDISGMKG